MPRIAAFPRGFFKDLVEGRMTFLKWIALAGQAEVDGIEAHPRFLESLDSAYLRRVRQEAAARNLKIAMMGGSPDMEGIRGTRKMLQVAAELGARMLRIFPGPDPRREIDGIHELLPYAESTSVVLVVENPSGLAVLEGVKSPWLKVQIDPLAAAGEDLDSLVEKVLPRLAALRVVDRPPGDDDRIFSKLAGAGFDGWVIFEGGEGDTVEKGLENLRQGVRSLRARLARHFPKAKP